MLDLAKKEIFELPGLHPLDDGKPDAHKEAEKQNDAKWFQRHCKGEVCLFHFHSVAARL